MHIKQYLHLCVRADLNIGHSDGAECKIELKLPREMICLQIMSWFSNNKISFKFSVCNYPSLI